jgi:cysteate synthase
MSAIHYELSCLGCGKRFADTERGFLLGCDAPHPPALLRASYAPKLTVRPGHPGIFRYSDWLPIRRVLPRASAPVVFQAGDLGRKLGLDNLVIAFNGYWPERGAAMEACTFKELEALPICARIPDAERRTMVIASAGNTGRAFLQVAAANGVPVLVVVPEFALPQMWITGPRPAGVRLAVLQGNVDYYDAIELSSTISALDGYYPEGGARNVARRDGMGTVVLAAAEKLGEIPAHYFQAIGSGTGAIAAWEMATRLAADGGYGSRVMRLHLAQNSPFTPMTDAWEAGRRDLAAVDEADERRRIAAIRSPVLSNRKPPWGLTGGVFDALSSTSGAMYAVTNAEAEQAGRMFEEIEGCDLDPAAEVAFASLAQAAARGRVGRGDLVLLNLTGGGQKRLAAEGRARAVAPDVTFQRGDRDAQTVARKLA